MALEIDLTGQVSSRFRKRQFLFRYRWAGGFQPRGGQDPAAAFPILVLPSTTEDGRSRIVSRLGPGAGVVISRGTVHYVVTEYGSAYLHGKSVQDRTLALISIAHPDHRPQLLKEAIDAKFIREEFADVRGQIRGCLPGLYENQISAQGWHRDQLQAHSSD